VVTATPLDRSKFQGKLSKSVIADCQALANLNEGTHCSSLNLRWRRRFYGFAVLHRGTPSSDAPIVGLFVGPINVYFSLHPDTKFYPRRLATTQPMGTEQHPLILYRILFLAVGLLVIWDSSDTYLFSISCVESMNAACQTNQFCHQKHVSCHSYGTVFNSLT
jgi:hypothetical protein